MWSLQGFIQDFEMRGGKHDGSMMVVAHKSILTHACLIGGSGGMLPQENFEFRPPQIAIWDKIVV